MWWSWLCRWSWLGLSRLRRKGRNTGYSLWHDWNRWWLQNLLLLGRWLREYRLRWVRSQLWWKNVPRTPTSGSSLKKENSLCYKHDCRISRWKIGFELTDDIFCATFGEKEASEYPEGSDVPTKEDSSWVVTAGGGTMLGPSEKLGWLRLHDKPPLELTLYNDGGMLELGGVFMICEEKDNNKSVINSDI